MLLVWNLLCPFSQHSLVLLIFWTLNFFFHILEKDLWPIWISEMSKENKVFKVRMHILLPCFISVLPPLLSPILSKNNSAFLECPQSNNYSINAHTTSVTNDQLACLLLKIHLTIFKISFIKHCANSVTFHI